MAYFQPRPDDGAYTHRFAPVREEEDDLDEEEYDDGFDELADPGVPEEDLSGEDPLSEEERRAEKRRKFRLAADLRDLGGLILGMAVILALVAFLISMYRFVSSDFENTFSLWLKRF